MDDIVARAMARWPNVPAVYGWLRLDRRGRWRIEGEIIRHPATIAFIGRNYLRDDAGRWYFQNGPQRVFVDLDYLPWVLREAGDGGGLVVHTGAPVARVESAWLDRAGALIVVTEHGPGLVEDRDLDALAEYLCAVDGAALDDEALEAGLESLAAGAGAALGLRYRDRVVALGALDAPDAPARFGFVPRPREGDGAG